MLREGAFKEKKKKKGRRQERAEQWQLAAGVTQRDDRDLGHLTRRSVACPTARNSTGHTRKYTCPRVSRTVVSVVCWCRFQRALPAKKQETQVSVPFRL